MGIEKEIVIREYDSNDEAQLKECLKVLQDYVQVLEPHIVATGDQVYDSYCEYLLEQVNANDGKIVVAELKDELVGFIGFYFTQEAYESVKSLYVSDLVVLEEHRGLGLGTKLLGYADKYAKEKGSKLIKIGVLAKNTGAADLYRKNGFVDYSLALLKVLP